MVTRQFLMISFNLVQPSPALPILHSTGHQCRTKWPQSYRRRPAQAVFNDLLLSLCLSRGGQRTSWRRGWIRSETLHCCSISEQIHTCRLLLLLQYLWLDHEHATQTPGTGLRHPSLEEGSGGRKRRRCRKAMLGVCTQRWPHTPSLTFRHPSLEEG